MIEPGRSLSEAAPAGIYLRGDRAAYRRLRNAFNAGQTAYRALSETPEAMADRALQQANEDAWRALATLAGDTLSTTSRDLEVACWYVAAQAHGAAPFAACAVAMEALARLVEAEFEALHPIPPEDKLPAESDGARQAEIVAGKLRPFVQLFGETDGGGCLIRPLGTAPLAGGISYLDAVAVEKSGGLAALPATAPAEGDTTRAHIATLRDALARLGTALSARAATAGTAAPSVAHVDRALSDMQRVLDILVPGTRATTRPASKTDPGETDPGGAAATGPARPVAGAPIADREQAVEAIATLAAHFRATEPHSPVHALLSRAARWARMPLADLYAEILGPDSPGLAQMTLMTGLESGHAAPAAPAATAPPPVVAPPPPAMAAPPAAGTGPPVDDPPPADDLSGFQW